MKPKVLLILHLPKPVHGAALMGEMIRNSNLFNSEFETEFLRLSTVPQKYKAYLLIKIFRLIKLYYCVFVKLIFKKYDIVYITPCATGLSFYKDYVVSNIVKLLHKGKIVYHFHNKGISTNGFVPEYIKKRFFVRSNVILISKLLYSDISKYVDEKNVYYCANCIVDNKIDRHNIDVRENSKPSILFLSNMLRSKGVFDLLDALKILELRGGEFSCTFAGAWYEIKEDEFCRNIKELGMKTKIRHLGAVYGIDKIKAFEESDIFVFPSHDETFGLVILEAMQFKVPVIATNVGGIPDIIKDGDNGLLVEPNDPTGLANSLEILLNNKTKCKNLGDNGYKTYYSKYTLKMFENNFISIMRQML